MTIVSKTNINKTKAVANINATKRDRVLSEGSEGF